MLTTVWEGLFSQENTKGALRKGIRPKVVGETGEATLNLSSARKAFPYTKLYAALAIPKVV